MSNTHDQYRSYNDFSKLAIAPLETSSLNNQNYGWSDNYTSPESSTPINADNLNAMLQMLIYIRNVIGKTTDFATNVNGKTNISQPDSNLIIDGDGNRTDKTIATYIQEVANAIIGQGDDLSNTQITKTLSGLKSYLEGLDVSEISEDNKWIKNITQTDGRIEAKLEQPGTNSISVQNIDIKDKAADKTYSNLTEVINDESDIRHSQIDDVNIRINNLNLTSSPEEFEWAKSITQTNGQIEVEYTRPDAQDITYSKDSEGTNLDGIFAVNTALDKLDITIGNLSTIKFDGENEITDIDTLIDIIQKVINDRIERDIELLGTGASDSQDTIRKNKTAIEDLNINLTAYISKHRDDYTNAQLDEMFNSIGGGDTDDFDIIDCGSSDTYIDDNVNLNIDCGTAAEFYEEN